MINNFEQHSQPRFEARHISELSEEELREYLRLRDSKDYEINKGIDIPDKPTFLKIMEFRIHGVKGDGTQGEFTNITLHNVTVFFCHAESDRDNMVTAQDRLSIPELLEEFRINNELSAVLACNTGSFRLSDDLIYPIGDPPPIPCCFNRESGIILDAHLAFEHEDCRPAFNIPDKYFKK